MSKKKCFCVLLSLILSAMSFMPSVMGASVSANESEPIAGQDSVSQNAFAAMHKGEEIISQETAQEGLDTLPEEVIFEEDIVAEGATPDNAIKTPGAMKIYAVWAGGSSGNAKGDCVLLEADGEYLLMDMGSWESYETIKAFLQSLGVKRLSLYYSHTHNDHTGGLAKGEGYESLLRDFMVEKVYVPDQSLSGVVDHSWHYGKFASVYATVYPGADLSKAIIPLKVGDTFSVGSALAEVLGPVNIEKLQKPTDPSNKGSKEVDEYENNLSLVTKFTCGGKSFLTSGDCLDAQEKLLVAKYKNALKADIFKLAHHGWSSGNTAEFLACIKPQISFACSTGSTDFNTDKNGIRYRETRTARRMAIKSGMVFMTGDEKDSLKIDTSNNMLSLYRMKEPAKKLTGWVTFQGGESIYQLTDTYYITENGTPLVGLQEIDGKLYDFSTGGCMERGAYVLDGKKEATYNGWVSYENEDGSKDFRYIDKDTGEIKRGLFSYQGQTYALDEKTGLRLKGVKKIGKNLYFVSNPGTIRKNQFCYLNNKKYYADKTGKLAVGFKKILGKYYYFEKDGAVLKGTTSEPINEIDGKYYYIGTDGSIKTGITYASGGVIYHFDKKGKMLNPPKVSTVSVSGLKAKTKSIEVRWKKKSSVDGYAIYISTKKNSGYTLAKLIKKKSQTKTTIKKLTPKKTYYVKIRGFRYLGKSKIYSKYSKAKKIKVL